MIKRPGKTAARQRPPKRPMLPTDRLAYSAITERAPLKLPDGARMVVWVIVNVEEWDPHAADAAHRADAAGRRLADARRAELGVARIRQPGRLLAPGQGVRRVRHSRRARHQRLGARRLSGDRARRGRTPVGIHRPRLHPAQHAEGGERARRYPQRRATVIAKATGKPPRGWLGPGLTETWETPDLLAEEGYDYVADWVLDDQPVWLKTRGKPIINVPYTQECNDVAMMLIQHHKASRILRPRARPVRADLCRCRRLGARHGAGRASLHHGRAAPAEIFPPRVRGHPQKDATSSSGPARRSSTGILPPDRKRRDRPANTATPSPRRWVSATSGRS